MNLPGQLSSDDSVRIIVSGSIEVRSIFKWIQASEHRQLQVLLSESIASSATELFPINSKLKQLQNRDGVCIHTAEHDDLPTAVISSKQLYLRVTFGQLEEFTEIDDRDLYQEFKARFDSLFDSSVPLEINVAPWHELLRSLEKQVGHETKQQYVRLIQVAAESDIYSLDEISVAIIATALAGGLQNDIAKWGEDTDFASAATFSRRKGALEEDGVITTEKVPVEIGRPKHRLRLSDRVSGLSMDIGVSSKEVDGSEPMDTPDSPPDHNHQESDDGGTMGSTNSSVSENTEAEFITKLNDELEELISSN